MKAKFRLTAKYANTEAILPRGRKAVTTEAKAKARRARRDEQYASSRQEKRTMELKSFITGFTDGEGTFSVSFNYRRKLNTRVEVRPSFSISQHKRNLAILQRIQTALKCGSIRFSKRDQNYKFEVRSIDDLIKKVIPHFKKFPLQTSKSEDFRKFSVICGWINRNLHRNPAKLREIIELAYTMNASGQRRYTKKQLLKFAAR